MKAFRYFKILIFALKIISYSTGYAQTNVEEYNQLANQAIQAKDHAKAAFYAYEISKVYSAKKDFKKAIQYLTQCLSYGKKSGDRTLMCLAHSDVGTLLSKEKSFSKALDNYQSALRIARELKKENFIPEILIQIATTYAQLGRHKKAIDPLEEALSLALLENNVLQQQKCYELLVKYYTTLGDTNKAKKYDVLNKNILTSQQNEKKNAQKLNVLKRQVQRVGKEKDTAQDRLEQQNRKLRETEDSLLAIKYSLEETADSLKHTQEISEWRQLQINLLNKDKEIAQMRIVEQNIRLKNEALIRNSIIVGALLVFSLVMVIFSSYHRKLKANRKIAEQNKNITSSINYARRIQEAMFPKPDHQKKSLPESFVLLKPRDSVSGDFYWFSEIKNWYNPDVIFAAVDCTGHGVPGAFMSMIGISALNAILGKGVAESNLILDALDTEIRAALQQDTSKNNDGMDVALCIYRREMNTLEFSGAKNPLVYIQNNELHLIKGDVHSIGGKNKNGFTFQKHRISIHHPTMVYIFSDGYSDQFGGQNNTKFMSKKFQKLLLDIHQKPLPEQMEILNTTLTAWKGNQKQTDDILVMGVKLEPIAVA
jgi:serine phosphatase RsbU (regulator of sigma subunit)